MRKAQKLTTSRKPKIKSSAAQKVIQRGQGPIILFAAPASSLNLATLASDLSAFYQEHRDYIHNELEIGMFGGPLGLERNFASIPGVTDELVLTEAVVDDFIHQLVPTSATTFNPTADVVVPSARILKVRDYQGDLQFADDVIERTHLMYIGKMKQLEGTDSPDETQTFIEYLFWDMIMKRAKRTLRKAVFQATFDNTAPYNWNKIMDGWEKLIADAITATDISAVPLGTPDVSTIIPTVESVFDTLDVAVKRADDLVCFLRSDLYTLWIRANRFTLGRNSTFDSSAKMVIDGYSNCVVMEEPDFTDTGVAIYRNTNPIISTSNGEGTWEFQRFDRLTKMMFNGKVGLQFTTINPAGKQNLAIGQ